MPTVYAVRRARFNAAHRLHNPEKSDDWNREVFGKCNSAHFHGHNFELEVVVAGEPDPETGFVIDLADLKRIVDERVTEELDHKNLNTDVPFLQGVLPSTENVAVAIWQRLHDQLPAGRLHAIRLRETENNAVEYYGE